MNLNELFVSCLFSVSAFRLQKEASYKRPRAVGSSEDSRSVACLLRVAKCMRCGTENVGHFRFCHQCGVASGGEVVPLVLPATAPITVDMSQLVARRSAVTAAMADRPGQVRKLKTAAEF